MPKRSGKRPADLNRLAASLVEDATDEVPPEESRQSQVGRLGGQKGGSARAHRLTPERRAEIARNAARARWG